MCMTFFFFFPANVWSEGETRLLLDGYSKYLSQVGPMKRFRNKKTMWTQLSKDLADTLNSSKTWEQCENRYKTVTKRKKVAVQNNNSTGASREPIPYESELAQIASIDDSIHPEVIKGVGVVTKKSAATDPTDGEQPSLGKPLPRQPPAKRTKLSMEKVLLQIHEQREKNRDRRHKELIAAIRETFAKEQK